MSRNAGVAPSGQSATSESLAAAKPLNRSHSTADLTGRARRQSYVVRVVTTMTNGHVKVQHYASLHAAVKAEERATARGCVAVLSLCRVVPVGIVTADELATLRAAEVAE